MSKNYINPYTSPYMPNQAVSGTQPTFTNPYDINKIYSDIQAMYNAIQNPQPQPVIISQAQNDFFKSKTYLYKLQEYFTGYMLNKYGAEFKSSENYKLFEEWANEEFKKYEIDYNKKKPEVK